MTNHGSRPAGSSSRALNKTFPPFDQSWLALLALVLVAAPGLIQAANLLVQKTPVVIYGDQALTALAARRAADFHQLLGVYSRYGFHEPGPAVFYLLAPFTAAIAGLGRAVYFGSAVINTVSSIAVVWIMARRFGAKAALWSAGMLDLYMFFLQVRLMRQPWNPYLVVLPVVLFAVLWVLAISRVSGSWVWLSAIGTYEVQTHLATAIFAVVMIAIAGAVIVAQSLAGHRKPPWRAWLRKPRHLIGIAFLTALWIPPAIEVLLDRPNNIVLLWRFFSAPHSEPSFRSAISMTASAVGVMPLGDHIFTLVIHRSSTALKLDAVALVALSLITLTVAYRRRQWEAAAFLFAGTAGFLLGAFSLMHASGGVLLYFALWLSFVPVAVLLGLGVAIFSPPKQAVQSGGSSDRKSNFRLRHGSSVVLALLATTAAVPATLASARLRPAGKPDVPILQVTLALEQAAGRTVHCRHEAVSFTMSDPVLWPEVAGIATKLRQAGCFTTVSNPPYGTDFGPSGQGLPIAGHFGLYLTPLPSGLSATGQTVAKVGNQLLIWTPTARKTA